MVIIREAFAGPAAASRCGRCGVVRYEHADHDHAGLAKQHGRCPFGDCGSYVSGEVRDGAG